MVADNCQPISNRKLYTIISPAAQKVNNRALLKYFEHLNHVNPDKFEVEDLERLIKSVHAVMFKHSTHVFIISDKVVHVKSHADFQRYRVYHGCFSIM